MNHSGEKQDEEKSSEGNGEKSVSIALSFSRSSLL